jgi:hypothetical protein
LRKAACEIFFRNLSGYSQAAITAGDTAALEKADDLLQQMQRNTVFLSVAAHCKQRLPFPSHDNIRLCNVQGM